MAASLTHATYANALASTAHSLPCLHYLEPQMRPKPSSTRHAVQQMKL